MIAHLPGCLLWSISLIDRFQYFFDADIDLIDRVDSEAFYRFLFLIVRVVRVVGIVWVGGELLRLAAVILLV